MVALQDRQGRPFVIYAALKRGTIMVVFVFRASTWYHPTLACVNTTSGSHQEVTPLCLAVCRTPSCTQAVWFPTRHPPSRRICQYRPVVIFSLAVSPFDSSPPPFPVSSG